MLLASEEQARRGREGPTNLPGGVSPLGEAGGTDAVPAGEHAVVAPF